MTSSVSSAARLSLLDAHCHLQDTRIASCVDVLLSQARAAGVRGWVCNGTCEDDWDAVLSLSQRYPREVLPSFGLHPWMVASRSPAWLSRLESILEACPAAAVGEVGLHKGKLKKGPNGKAPPELASMDTQVLVMRQQLELARRLKRPVSVHCVNAYGHLKRLLTDMGRFPEGVVLHSFGGPANCVAALADCNSFFSISGFACSGSSTSKTQAMLEAIPRERLLLETDCPDATPPEIAQGTPLLRVPSDGAAAGISPASTCCSPPEDTPAEAVTKGTGPGGAAEHTEKDSCPESCPAVAPAPQPRPLNHPGNIIHNCAFVANCLSLPLEEVAKVTLENARLIFPHFNDAS